VRRDMIAHFLGAAGVVCALLALLAVFDQAWEQVYGWLGLALIVQAAGADEAALLPLPDSVDLPDLEEDVRHAPIAAIAAFLTTVFVPVVAMLHAGFLDGLAGAAVASIIMLSALYRLAFIEQPANNASRSLGLPAAWSIIGFYLHAFDATPMAAVLAIGLGIVLGLLPLNWPNPLRSERWALLTRALVVVWFVTAAYALVHGFQATASITKAILLAATAYGLVLTALLARSPAAKIENN
jgi:phosphatidylcholine synthase